MQQLAAGGARVDLALTAPFAVGALWVVPAARRVERNGEREMLEPRVMQVLVALAQAGGEVVGRDELIARCWDGRVVVDNAINRVISRLRRLSSTLGEGCFRIETVARVGYRLEVMGGQPGTEALLATADTISAFPSMDGPSSPPAVPQLDVAPAAPPPSQAPRLSRRALLAGGMAVVVLGGGGAVLSLNQRDARERALARELLRNGVAAGELGDWEDMRQSVTYLEKATEAAPDWAEAWGLLALALRNLADASSPPVRDEYGRRARAAAQRALALDGGNVDAQVMLALEGAVFRRWADIEAASRRLLQRYPGHRYVSMRLGRVLLDTGRFRDAAALAESLLEHLPVDLGVHLQLIRGRWGSGDTRGAGQALERAAHLWPQAGSVWAIRTEFLAHHGRAREALALLDDPWVRPQGSVWLPTNIQAEVLRALVSRSPASVMKAVEALVASRAPNSRSASAGTVVAWLAMLGAADEALNVAEDYLLGYRDGSGVARRPVGGQDRSTWWLFLPPVEPLRTHPRFAALTRDVGLDDYWRMSGTRPDSPA